MLAITCRSWPDLPRAARPKVKSKIDKRNLLLRTTYYYCYYYYYYYYYYYCYQY